MQYELAAQASQRQPAGVPLSVTRLCPAVHSHAPEPLTAALAGQRQWAGDEAAEGGTVYPPFGHTCEVAPPGQYAVVGQRLHWAPL